MSTHAPAPFPVRWGILGCGHIAASFISDLRLVPGNSVTAVASQTPGRAHTFANTHQVAVALDNYQALCQRSDIDAIYVATTHPAHLANSQLALHHRKAVLCEKPLTMNARQGRALAALARQQGVFLMEAMWTRFFPGILALLEELQHGVIGPVRLIQADFGISAAWERDGRMVNPALGGGALLDLGIYPITFAQLVSNANPDQIFGVIRRSDQGVDAQSSYLLGYPDGCQAQLMSAFDLLVPHQARIMGGNGRIVLDDFFHPTAYTVEIPNRAIRRVEHPVPGHGYQYEIAHVQQCLMEDRRESPLRPLASTLAVLDTMDTLRSQWNLGYDADAD